MVIVYCRSISGLVSSAPPPQQYSEEGVGRQGSIGLIGTQRTN